jgi:hypothetical protein
MINSCLHILQSNRLSIFGLALGNLIGLTPCEGVLVCRFINLLDYLFDLGYAEFKKVVLPKLSNEGFILW